MKGSYRFLCDGLHPVIELYGDNTEITPSPHPTPVKASSFSQEVDQVEEAGAAGMVSVVRVWQREALIGGESVVSGVTRSQESPAVPCSLASGGDNSLSGVTDITHALL